MIGIFEIITESEEMKETVIKTVVKKTKDKASNRVFVLAEEGINRFCNAGGIVGTAGGGGITAMLINGAAAAAGAPAAPLFAVVGGGIVGIFSFGPAKNICIQSLERGALEVRADGPIVEIMSRNAPSVLSAKN